MITPSLHGRGMRLVLLVCLALVGSTFLLSPSVADADCGDGLVLNSITPTGVVDTATPLIEARFLDTAPHCGLQGWGGSSPGWSYSWALEGDEYVFTWTPSAPLLPGHYTPTANIQEWCCNSAGTQSSASASWSFVVVAVSSSPQTVVVPAQSASGSTPAAVPAEEVCSPTQIVCVEPTPLPYTASWSLDTGTTVIVASVDPNQRTYYGPYHVPPIWICRDPCGVPDRPLHGSSIALGIRLLVQVGSTTVPVDQEFSYTLP